MKQKLKIVSSLFIAGLFLLMAFGSGGSDNDEGKVNIKSEQEIKSYLLGKWNANKTYSGMVVYYRLEITENQIKYWKRADATMAGAGADEWDVNPSEVINYSIGALETDSHDNKFRLLGKFDFGSIIIRGGHKNDLGWLEIGETEYDFNSESIYMDKGWK